MWRTRPSSDRSCAWGPKLPDPAPQGPQASARVAQARGAAIERMEAAPRGHGARAPDGDWLDGGGPTLVPVKAAHLRPPVRSSKEQEGGPLRWPEGWTAGDQSLEQGRRCADLLSERSVFRGLPRPNQGRERRPGPTGAWQGVGVDTGWRSPSLAWHLL